MKNSQIQKLSGKAQDFIVELTHHNVIEKKLHQEKDIEKENRDNNKAMLDLLLQRGIKEKDLPLQIITDSGKYSI
ncbi:MAG: hypothetical protein R3E32_20035 [Chitinophagales bacterium]